MKKIFKPITALATGLVLMLTACRKPNDIVQSPVPPLGKSTNQFQLVIDSLPGESLAGVTNIFTIVTLVNEQGTVVINTKKLSLNFTGKYYAEKLQLPDGNYK